MEPPRSKFDWFDEKGPKYREVLRQWTFSASYADYVVGPIVLTGPTILPPGAHGCGRECDAIYDIVVEDNEQCLKRIEFEISSIRVNHSRFTEKDPFYAVCAPFSLDCMCLYFKSAGSVTIKWKAKRFEPDVVRKLLKSDFISNNIVYSGGIAAPRLDGVYKIKTD